jgi:hypothetical protein
MVASTLKVDASMTEIELAFSLATYKRPAVRAVMPTAGKSTAMSATSRTVVKRIINFLLLRPLWQSSQSDVTNASNAVG